MPRQTPGNLIWERRLARWDRWHTETLAELQAKAAAGDEQATDVVSRYDRLIRSGVKGRTALNRVLRGR